MAHDLMGHKENDRMWDLHRKADKPSPGPAMFYPDRELRWFMQRYKGKRPAWDFIQYCLKTKLL